MGGLCVVVACRAVCAPQAAGVVTFTSVGGGSVEVARSGVLATSNLVVVANAISIHISCASAVAVVTRLRVNARHEVCGVDVVVAGGGHHTAVDLELVAHPVAVGVVHASLAVALVELRSVGASLSAGHFNFN